MMHTTRTYFRAYTPYIIISAWIMCLAMLLIPHSIHGSILENRHLRVDDSQFIYTNSTSTAGSGNVGILIPTPEYKLHVSGNTNINGPISTVPISNNSSTTTIDWRLGNKQILNVAANSRTLTFTNPKTPTTLILVLSYTGNGNITWPSSVKWPSGIAPNLTRTSGATDIVYFYYQSGSYYGATVFDY